MARFNLLLHASLSAAAVSIVDPSDYADLAGDASDNAIKAVYDIEPTLYQTNAILGPYFYDNGTDVSIDHTTLTNSENDTSVIVVTDSTQLNLSYVDVVKYGYCSNLYQSSFYGLNAAVNVANGSTAYIDHANITTHNGAANVYSFGDNTVVHVSNTDLYSSGPVAHGLYAGGNGTVYASNVRHFSGGNRCSSFSGDTPAGYIYVNDSIAHTTGIGSALFYALGEVHATNVVGVTEQAPALFADGGQTAVFDNVDFTAHLLAGTVFFSSSSRLSGASLSFTNSRLTAAGSTSAALWFGNIIASASLTATEVNSTSGVLLVANSSQVTQEFSYFAGGEQNGAIQPAQVNLTVAESSLAGDIVAFNGSSVRLALTRGSTWRGAFVDGDDAAAAPEFDVFLDASSAWEVTGDSAVGVLASEDVELRNVRSGGFSVAYDGSLPANAWLDGETKALEGGGVARPL
ncbi:hypothetical protein HDK64DRAFT_243511 [Phyllosticta capitalensis]